jgi:hypothetical protein
VNIADFINRWKHTEASERANKDSFLKELCRVLGVPEPDGKTGDRARDHYVFEADAFLHDEAGQPRVGSMDLFRRGCFVFEAKQGSTTAGKKVGTARRGTPGWNVAMTEAAGQAFGYARTLDAPPPFVIVADIGHCFDLYASFDGTGAYRPFPNAQKNRLLFSDLAKHADVLRKIWLDPLDLDPKRYAERVTREVAERIAELARELEGAGHRAEVVARFLMRCLFTMFAEDIGLLRSQVFTNALAQQWIPEPTTFKDGVESLWEAMNAGKRFFLLGKLLHFNGGLFKEPVALPLSAAQLELLYKAARCNWAEVEPAIFGTLIERALNPAERHRLGAHFTPRAFVERLLIPTIETPLRAVWDEVRVEVRTLVPPDRSASPVNVRRAQELVRTFHRDLCGVRVLDPACGSGNFLYVALDLFKRLESEVLALLYDLGVAQGELTDDLLVTPKQFLGIELRPWSKEIAELVLWIGYLQWHHRTYGGTKTPPEPVLRDYRNVECRDAMIEWDRERPVSDRTGSPKTRWDGASMTAHKVTGQQVPDEKAQVTVFRLEGTRRASWPKADFIVGNPPFLGKLHFQSKLGFGYTEALREAYRGEVPDGSDLVMYWWRRAATELANSPPGRFGKRFGFITTNSITQTFNRRVLAASLEHEAKLHLSFAIPDHPWVDDQNGASVRIAMTVCEVGKGPGVLARVVDEKSEEDGPPTVRLSYAEGVINSDLTLGANVAAASSLRANEGLASMGPMLGARGFVLTEAERMLFLKRDGRGAARVIRPLQSGRDLVQRSRGLFAIDLHGLRDDEVRSRYPALYQRLVERVLPVRRGNSDPKLREAWWLFRRSNDVYRTMLTGLPRFIATTETAKHRIFTFLDAEVLAEHGTVSFGLSDAFHLGVLSSRIHVSWALAAGGRLGIGNDPRYNKTRCFDTFPFPDCSREVRLRIGELAEAIDEHRKRQCAKYPKLTLTDVYNVLSKLRLREALSEKDRTINDQGLVSVLYELHELLDRAVAQAYGWPVTLTDSQYVEWIAELNRERAREEAGGLVRWLQLERQATTRSGRVRASAPPDESCIAVTLRLPWPSQLPKQVTAVRDLLSATGGAWSASDVARNYADVQEEEVLPALDTLEALGLVASFNHGESRRWRRLAKGGAERPPSDRPAQATTYPMPGKPAVLLAAESPRVSGGSRERRGR